jgi:carotenoid 1,2-hydratase
MNMISKPSQHPKTIKQHPGGYRWYYFDATSEDGELHFVVIFYRGNPFSTRYISALEDASAANPLPGAYPAISISVYEKGEPIYYSFAEFEEADFTVDKSKLRVGPHKIKVDEGEEYPAYTLHLDEQLPCGDQLKAELQFKGKAGEVSIRSDHGGRHRWHLVEARAEVSGHISLSPAGSPNRDIAFSGMGYHDQNAGREPMKEHFLDWYWGRFHFPSATLIYYVMNKVNAKKETNAWLLDPETGEVREELREVELNDKSRSLFGLRSFRRLNLSFQQSQVQVQQTNCVDNGPFYQRFLSEAFLSKPAEGGLESAGGMSEYIYPERIHTRVFWPLVNMRIRQTFGKPHWVQQSKRLYQWTW